MRTILFINSIMCMCMMCMLSNCIIRILCALKYGLHFDKAPI